MSLPRGVWVGLKSVIMTFPRYTQLLRINAEIFVLLQSTSQAVRLKMNNKCPFKVALIRLQGKQYQTVLTKP